MPSLLPTRISADVFFYRYMATFMSPISLLRVILLLARIDYSALKVTCESLSIKSPLSMLFPLLEFD